MLRLSRILAGCWFAVTVVSCGGSPNASPPNESGGDAAQANATPRIVSMGPNITETVFALGMGHCIVGVSSYCDYPSEVNAIQKVGGPFDADKEAITMLAPDLLLLQGQIQDLADLGRQIGARVVSVDMDSLASIDAGIATIGEVLACATKADALRNEIQQELASIRDAVSDKPKRRVLIITGRSTHNLDSLFTVGSQSFVSELVEVAGGENIFGDVDADYFEASKESVVAKAPEVILEFHAGENLSAEEQAAFIADWKGLASLPAAQNGEIHLLLESYTLRPGPRVAKTAADIAALLHPGIQVQAP